MKSVHRLECRDCGYRIDQGGVCNPNPPEVELRPEVQWFAEQMELRLRANDHKGGWKDEDEFWLWGRIYDEWRELLDAIDANPNPGHQDVIREAADVANFAMMIADRFRWEVLGVRV